MGGFLTAKLETEGCTPQSSKGRDRSPATAPKPSNQLLAVSVPMHPRSLFHLSGAVSCRHAACVDGEHLPASAGIKSSASTHASITMRLYSCDERLLMDLAFLMIAIVLFPIHTKCLARSLLRTATSHAQHFHQGCLHQPMFVEAGAKAVKSLEHGPSTSCAKHNLHRHRPNCTLNC